MPPIRRHASSPVCWQSESARRRLPCAPRPKAGRPEQRGPSSSLPSPRAPSSRRPPRRRPCMKALKRSFIVLGPALFLLLAAAGPPADQRFEETAQVLAIEVPVNVVGRDGQPVRGLKAADFEVFDEGSRQPITSFEAVDLDVVSPPADAARPAAPVMPATPAGRSSDELESSARRHFLLLFDLSFSNPTAILRARLAARGVLLHSLRHARPPAVAPL